MGENLFWSQANFQTVKMTINYRVVLPEPSPPISLTCTGTDDFRSMSESTLIARFMGPTWGPSGADMTQVGLMLVPWTLLSGVVPDNYVYNIIQGFFMWTVCFGFLISCYKAYNKRTHILHSCISDLTLKRMKNKKEESYLATVNTITCVFPFVWYICSMGFDTMLTMMNRL